MPDAVEWHRDTSAGRMRSRFVGAPRDGVPEVVVVQGMAVADYLMPAVAELGRWTRAHLVELPGFAGSGQPTRELDVPGYAAAVVEWLDAAGLGPVLLAGHSSGTQLAARAAACDGRVVGVVLASPTVAPIARPLPRMLLRWWLDGRHEPPGLTASHLPEWRRAGAPGRPHVSLGASGGMERAGASSDGEWDVVMSRLRPSDVVASFDSASVLHAGLAAALHGRPFPHLGHRAAAGAAIRVAGRLPWPLLLRSTYAWALRRASTPSARRSRHGRRGGADGRRVPPPSIPGGVGGLEQRSTDPSRRRHAGAVAAGNGPVARGPQGRPRPARGCTALRRRRRAAVAGAQLRRGVAPYA
jgi:pimeloyl-ACP methyl ester carboxylesterase